VRTRMAYTSAARVPARATTSTAVAAYQCVASQNRCVHQTIVKIDFRKVSSEGSHIAQRGFATIAALPRVDK